MSWAMKPKWENEMCTMPKWGRTICEQANGLLMGMVDAGEDITSLEFKNELRRRVNAVARDGDDVNVTQSDVSGFLRQAMLHPEDAYFNRDRLPKYSSRVDEGFIVYEVSEVSDVDKLWDELPKEPEPVDVSDLPVSKSGKIRLSNIAHHEGKSNNVVVQSALAMGLEVKSHSSSITPAQADGLIRFLRSKR